MTVIGKATPGFYRCMGDVKQCDERDNLCDECVSISKDEFIKAVFITYLHAIEDAKRSLMFDLRGIV